MKTYISLFILIVAGSLVAQKPNIIIIQVDDMGYDDLSINGNKVSHTPNLDAFSEESVRFDNFMVNSVCAPTRASLLTGRDFWKTGVSAMHGGKDFLNLNETTFANIFKENDYTTGIWGKWHSGKADGYWPWDRGFDEGYYAELYKYFPSSGWYNQYPKKTRHKGEWSPKVIVDYAVDFISKNKDKPFLAYVSFLSVHGRRNAPEYYKKKYRKEGRSENFTTLLGMLSFMDDEVGRLLNHIYELGLDENTVIMFMSDNGPIKDKENEVEWRLRNNHNFLGNKARIWQNGLKSPLYVRWKNQFEPSNVPRLVSVTDIFPTLLDIANLKLPASNLPLDGRSILSYLKGNLKKLSEKEAIFSHWHPYANHWEPFIKEMHWDPLSKEQVQELDFNKQRITIMDEHYKYLYNAYNVKGGPKSSKGECLIDLVSDPLESNNIVDEFPEIAAKYNAKIKAWFNEIKKTDGAFNSPVFQIGWNGKIESDICAFGAYKTHGVKNLNHFISGFNQKGDYALYNLNVHKSGRYKVTIKRTSNKKLKNGFSLKISSGKSSCVGELNKKALTELGEISLKQGLQSFKIELVNSLNGSEDLGAIQTIMFKLIGK